MENDLIIALKDEMFLFNSFSEVYLFGSCIKSATPQDVDILLIYTVYNDNIIEEKRRIESNISKKVGLPFDITIMNKNELAETKFLTKIKSYIKIK